MRIAVTVLVLCVASGCATGGDMSTSRGGRDYAGDGSTGPGEDGGPGRRYGWPEAPSNALGGGRHAYVVRLVELGIDVSTDTGIAPGIDLDGHVTPDPSDPVGCGEPDFTSPPRFGSRPGVDNQVLPMLQLAAGLNPDVSIDADIAEGLASGLAELIFEIEGVGDDAEDGEVTLAVYTGRLVGGGRPATQSMSYEGSTRTVIAGGQSWVIDAATPVARLDAYITGGRLYAGPSHASLRFALTGGRDLELELDTLVIEATLEGGDLVDGLLSGTATVDNVMSAVSGVTELGDYETLVYNTLTDNADIDLDPRSAPCDSLSVALVIEAADATIIR